MKKLKYRPEGKAIPSGKPFVYFLAHEKDFSLYFETTARQLMKAANCVIFYDDGAGEDCDEQTRFEDISHMKLVVVAVTARLLTDEGSSALGELRYAISKNITILPILQEKGIEVEFNRLFGNVQMLSVIPGDGTEISFENKLAKFLSSVLIGDELAEKVRAAFDAYIFLSYRKKDRKYADELMRLIHKNEFCRDIAIWYDEFLTPGEDFNDEIAAALDKSKLFAMAVTPNLVNEKNYVMDVEYRLAVKGEKRILPAELVPTDKSALEKYFENIPATVDPYDAPSLEDALMRSLENIAIRENDGDPEHNFFIGLAYLSGIDVEMDKDRALKLITESAEAGLPEAIRKLIDMYETGEATRHTGKESYFWQQRLVEVTRAEYKAKNDDESLRQLIDALHCIGQDHNAEEGRIELCKESVHLSEELISRTNNEWHERYLAFSYSCLADAYSRFDRVDEGEECHKKVISIHESLATRYEGDFHKQNLANAYSDFGRFYYFKKSDYSTSAEYYERAREIYESLYTVNKDEENANGLVSVYTDASRTYSMVARRDDSSKDAFERAENYLLSALKIRKDELSESESIRALSNLSGAYSNLESFYWNFEISEKRIECMQQQINISRRRYELSGELYHCSYLQSSLHSLVRHYVDKQMFAEASLYGDELIECAKAYKDELVSFWNTMPAHDLVISYEMNAEIYTGLGDWEKELMHRKNTILAGEENAEKYHVSHLLGIFWDYGALATRYFEHGMYEEAEDCARRELNCVVKVTREGGIFNAAQAMKFAVEDYIYNMELLGKTEEVAKYQTCKEIYTRCYTEEDENFSAFADLADMYLEYAEGCRDAERKKWRLRVLELAHFMKDIAKDNSRFVALCDLLRPEFPDAELDQK